MSSLTEDEEKAIDNLSNSWRADDIFKKLFE